MKINPKTILAALLCTTASFAFSADGVHLKKESTFKSEGSGFDYITYGGGKAYVGHRTEGLQVFDLSKDGQVSVVDKTKTSNGATLAPELDIGFSANADGTLTIFKISDLSVVQQIQVGEEMDSSRYDAKTKRLALFGLPDKDKKGSTVAVYQMPEGKKVGEFSSESAKMENSAADGNGSVFVAAQDLNSIMKIDMGTLSVSAQWPVPCKQPTGLDYDAVNKRLMVGCRGAFSEPMFLVVNAQTGATVFKTSTSPGNDGVAYDGTRKRIYVTNGIGAHLMVFEQLDADSYKLSEVIGTRPMAKTIALDPVSGDIFTITAEPIFDASKKNLSYIAPYYPNGFVKNTFKVLQYGR